MSSRAPTLSRRRFLVAGGAAAAATMVATKRPAPAVSARDKRVSRGYHASAHVNNYYRTTKV
jgi:hypothetical protein